VSKSPCCATRARSAVTTASLSSCSAANLERICVCYQHHVVVCRTVITCVRCNSLYHCLAASSCKTIATLYVDLIVSRDLYIIGVFAKPALSGAELIGYPLSSCVVCGCGCINFGLVLCGPCTSPPCSSPMRFLLTAVLHLCGSGGELCRLTSGVQGPASKAPVLLPPTTEGLPNLL
jgi:hypothetical protein